MISIERLSLRLLLVSFFVLVFNNLSIADEAVFRITLDNGLIILAKESPPKDLVSINITINAGPSSEGEYTASGISHLVEHLVFKGTTARKLGDIEKEMRSYGAVMNGAVSHDTTTFSVTLPVKYLTQALSIMKDMLANAVFDKAELEKEKDIILKEIKLNQDDPDKKLLVKLFENAYISHPYKYPPIGFEKLLQSLTRDDVVKYYSTRYIPNKMVIGVVGSINARDAALKVEEVFKHFRAASYEPVSRGAEEPPQIGKRVVEKEAPVTLSYLALGFHSTGLLNKDLFAMDVLSMILGRTNNSRLNKLLLKEKREVYSISAWNYTPTDPGLFVITALLDKDNIDSAEKDILSEIKRLKDGDILDSELESAKRMVSGDYVLSHESTEDKACDLAESEAATGNSDFYLRYVEGVSKVSKFDIRRAASQYLNEDNLTIVRLVPRKSEILAGVSVPKTFIEEGFKKYTLPNGLVLLLRVNINIPAASITVAFPGGLYVETGNNTGISSLAAKMMLDGTKKRKESDIKSAIEDRGGQINSFSGFNSLGLNLTVMKDDVGIALELISDIMTNSVFPQDEIEKEKMLTAAAIKDEDNDIFERGLLALRKLLFKNHPYGMRNIGEEASLKAIKRDDLLKFYSTRMAPNNTIIAISGDIEPEKIFKKASEIFKDAESRELNKTIVDLPPAVPSVSKKIKMDKEESLLIIGYKTIAINNPDRYPLGLLSGVLSGTSGRLFTALRGKAALAYTMGSSQKLGLDTGFILFYAATTKENIEEAGKLLFAEIKAISDTLITDVELDAVKKEMISSHKMLMETNAGNSFQSALDELYGLGYDNLYKFESETLKVTKEDIRRAAAKYLDPNLCVEVVIEPE